MDIICLCIVLAFFASSFGLISICAALMPAVARLPAEGEHA